MVFIVNHTKIIFNKKKNRVQYIGKFIIYGYNNMVNYTLFTNIIIYDLMDNNIGKLHLICAFHCFSQSWHCNYKNLTCRLSFRIKTTQHFPGFHSAANTCQLKCLYRLLVAWQYGTQELVFGMIITDPEHCRSADPL